jgi:hypothetical protein
MHKHETDADKLPNRKAVHGRTNGKNITAGTEIAVTQLCNKERK